MRIRTSLLLTICPLFILVGVTSGALLYDYARTQLLWGAEQEAQAVAVALAAHIENNGAGDDSSERLKRALSKAFSWKIVRRISLIPLDSNDSNRKSYLLTDTGELQSAPKIDIPAALVQENEVTTERIDETRLRAWAPFKILLRGKLYLLAAEIDTSHIAPTLAKLRSQIIFGTIIIFVMGSLLALAASRLLSGQISRLCALIAPKPSGVKPRSRTYCSIPELDNLSDSLDALVCLQRQERAHPNRETARFDAATLAQAFNKEFLPPVEKRLIWGTKSIDVLLQLANQASQKDIFEIIECDDKLLVFIGNLSHSNQSQGWIRRSALQTLVRQLGNRGVASDHILRSAHDLFDDLKARYVEIPKMLPPSGDAIIKCTDLSACGQINQSSFNVGKQPLLIHTLDASKSDAPSIYAQKVKNLTPHELLSELNPVFREHSSGVILCMGFES